MVVACQLIAVILIARGLSPGPDLWSLRFAVALLFVVAVTFFLESSGVHTHFRRKIESIEWRLDTLEMNEKRRREEEASD